ncbi:hypothetical protein A3Q56_08406 [Intoshia linei]|uniref:BRCT domain-containing protein n=1 Tax=Intoshia linei TaxID=1819745 RepID=A0A177APF9_9BILA|nr:hypothetical protein A3Q56_08406 [Intoshia linei]
MDYVLVDRDAGPKKIENIKYFNIKTLNEDEFINLITGKEKQKDKNNTYGIEIDPLIEGNSTHKENNEKKEKYQSHYCPPTPLLNIRTPNMFKNIFYLDKIFKNYKGHNKAYYKSLIESYRGRGYPYCLKKKKFVALGIFESYDRDTLHNIIKAHGGKHALNICKST